MFLVHLIIFIIVYIIIIVFYVLSLLFYYTFLAYMGVFSSQLNLAILGVYRGLKCLFYDPFVARVKIANATLFEEIYDYIFFLLDHIPLDNDFIVGVLFIITSVLFVKFLQDTKEREGRFAEYVIYKNIFSMDYSPLDNLVEYNETRIARYFIYLLLYVWTPYYVSVPIIFISYLVVCQYKILGPGNYLKHFSFATIFLSFLYIFFPLFHNDSLDIHDYLFISYLLTTILYLILFSFKETRQLVLPVLLKLVTLLLITFFLYTTGDLFNCINILILVYLLYFITLKVTYKLTKDSKGKSKRYRLLHFSVFRYTLSLLIFIFSVYHFMFMFGVTSNNSFLLYSTHQIK